MSRFTNLLDEGGKEATPTIFERIENFSLRPRDFSITVPRSLFVLLVIIFPLLSSCGTGVPIVLDPAAKNIRIAKSDPPDNYEEVGPVTGSDGSGCGLFGCLGTYEGATYDIKNKAQKLFGEYVQIVTLTEPHLMGDCYDNEYRITGTAYKKVRDLPSPTPILDSSQSNSMILEKARLLKQLRDEGLLTEQQYQEKQQKLLK